MINNLNIVFEEHIKSEEFGCLYTPTVLDLLKYGEEQLSLFLLPYRITLDILDMDDEVKKDINTYDLFFQGFMIDQNNSYYNILMDSLRYYFKTDLIYFNKYNYNIEVYYIDKDRMWKYRVIDRNNFDKLADIILQINNSERMIKEKEPEFKNDIQRDIYYKIKEGRKRKEEKNKISIGTILNVVMHGGKSFIPYREVKTMTLPQVMNSFNTILGIDDWDINFKKYLAGADPKKDELDLTYWVHKIKI